MRIAGVVALVLLVVEILSLGVLLPIDQAVWFRVLLVRGCTTDLTVDQFVWCVGFAMTALAAAAALLHLRRRGWAATWPSLALFATGALLNTAMKVLLSRERPSNLPGTVDGHGFPSGHVMSTTLAMLVVFVFSRSFRRPWMWRIAAVILAAGVAAGRVLYGAHWFLDVVGAVLTAFALAGFCLPAFERRPLAAPAMLAGMLALVLGGHALFPDAVVRLPSPLTRPGEEFLDVDLGAVGTSMNLTGNWAGHGHEDPAGSLAWLRGVGGVSVFETSWVEAAKRIEAGDTTAVIPPIGAEDGPGELLVLVARPDKESSSCRQVRVAVNGHIVTGFVPFVGWREYRIPLPRGTYRRGFNEVQLSVRAPDGAPERLAVSRFRLRLN